MWSLYFKEIKSYLSSILGYIFIGVFLIVTGLFIWVFPNINNVFFSGLSDLQGLFNISKFLFLFLVPAITMRTFAEERRQGTMELLFTKPLKDTQIIAAKFFSCLTLLVISLIPTLIYIVSVYNLGNPIGNIDMGSTWGSYLGLILLGSSFIAIGIFASSITNNQIVAFILAAPLCFIFYFGPDFIYSFDALGSFGYFIKTIGIDHHYTAISRGVIDSRDIIYFLSFIFIFLFATGIVLVSRKWYNRRFKQTTLVGFAAALLILVAVNILSAFLYVRVDLTQDKRHSLSNETIKLLKELDETIYIKVYLKGSDQPADYQLFAEETRAVLQEFRSYSKNIHFEFIDPVAGKSREEINNIYGEFAQKGLRPIPITRESEAGISTHYVLPGAIITYKNTEYPVTLVVSDPGYSDWLQYSIQELEYNFVATIRKLIHPIKPKVAFIDGHGELDFMNTSWVMWQLSRFYTVERVALNGKINALKEVIVKDSITNELEVKGNKYDILVIAQPTLPFSDADKFIIDQHIMYGGKVLWLVDATTGSIDSLQNSTEQFATMRNLRLNDMFFSYGVRLNANLVQDLSCQSIPLGMGDIGGQTQYKFFAFPYNLNIVNFSTHAIVRKMKEIKADFCGTIDFVGVTENLNKVVLMTTS
ncbi:MAG: gliding motility-associated ABC transporter permease subunit GldF, partial [Bacteroidales bacterium]|nr:gliding motility-associated ABC transporter permease subunit GldF [Bacteroidales bacterium]